MSPEYLNELADLADPLKLWQLSGLDQLKLPADQRKQLDTGIALRRYASHIAELRAALDQHQSVLITPLSRSGSARKSVKTPPDHKRLRRHYP